MARASGGRRVRPLRTASADGTHWLTDVLPEDPEGRIPAVPGRWRVTGDGAALTAAAEDGVQLDGSRGHFRPYDEDRTVQVENADRRARGLRLGGELSFRFEGAEHRLQIAVDEEDGSPRAVFGDATGGRSSYPFHLVKPGLPAARGEFTMDFNRSLLPPCAFAAHFIRPLPPSRNTHPFAVAAGERRPKGALATGNRRHDTPDSACQGHGGNACARRAPGCASRASAPPRSPSPRTFPEDET